MCIGELITRPQRPVNGCKNHVPAGWADTSVPVYHIMCVCGGGQTPSVPCIQHVCVATYLMISAYSRSLPLLSRHLRYMTDASTLAGEKVLGSFRREMTLSRMVLRRGHRRQKTGVTTSVRSQDKRGNKSRKAVPKPSRILMA